MERGRRPPSLVDFCDSAIKKIWLPWPPATAHKHPKHQRAVSLQPPAQWWREVKWERERGKETERGKSEGSWGVQSAFLWACTSPVSGSSGRMDINFRPLPSSTSPAFFWHARRANLPFSAPAACLQTFLPVFSHSPPTRVTAPPFISWMFLPVWARPLTPALHSLSILLPASSLHLFFLFIVSQHYHSPVCYFLPLFLHPSSSSTSYVPASPFPSSLIDGD